jgi:glycosyltransferase involved in cell wall biosynthesis
LRSGEPPASSARGAIIYLANSFPEATESYVADEIHELRKHGADLLVCAMRKPAHASPPSDQCFYVLPLSLAGSLRVSALFLERLWVLRKVLCRAIRSREHFSSRFRAVAHTWLGVYLAVQLRHKTIRHIHVHHGYFASWVGMVAAKLLNAGFSFTLHGSDLLVRPQFLDIKLQNCDWCFTVSEFNRQFIIRNYPRVEPGKVLVQRLGVDLADWKPCGCRANAKTFCIVTAGRLHPVKNHLFLLRACAALKKAGLSFCCLIAGEGGERTMLERAIVSLDLQREVALLGHIQRKQLPKLYARADVVVLTSHSEGLPVTLMEAMAMERAVIAPRITGMPELVVPGETGFLYEPDCLNDFLEKLYFVRDHRTSMDEICRAARDHVERHFNRTVNLASFAMQFLSHVNPEAGEPARVREETHANSLLQQI